MKEEREFVNLKIEEAMEIIQQFDLGEASDDDIESLLVAAKVLRKQFTAASKRYDSFNWGQK